MPFRGAPAHGLTLHPLIAGSGAHIAAPHMMSVATRCMIKSTRPQSCHRASPPVLPSSQPPRRLLHLVVSSPLASCGRMTCWARCVALACFRKRAHATLRLSHSLRLAGLLSRRSAPGAHLSRCLYGMQRVPSPAPPLLLDRSPASSSTAPAAKRAGLSRYDSRLLLCHSSLLSLHLLDEFRGRILRIRAEVTLRHGGGRK